MNKDQVTVRLKEILERMRDGTATREDELEYKRLKFATLLEGVTG